MGDLRRFSKRQENKAAAKINHEQDLLRIEMFGQKFLRHTVAHPNHAARSRHHHADRVAAQAEKFAEFVVEKHGQTRQQKHQADFLPVRKGFFKHAYADQNHGKGRELPQHLRGGRRNIVQTQGNENEVGRNTNNTQHQ